MRPPLLVVSLATLATLAAAAPAAHADQCAWVSPEVATRAAAELTHGRRVVHFCEPCKEKNPPPAVTIRADATVEPVASKRPHPEYREVALDGHRVDLAYLFVEQKPGEFVNVARLAGCPTTDVSDTLK